MDVIDLNKIIATPQSYVDYHGWGVDSRKFHEDNFVELMMTNDVNIIKCTKRSFLVLKDTISPYLEIGLLTLEIIDDVNIINGVAYGFNYLFYKNSNFVCMYTTYHNKHRKVKSPVDEFTK